MDKPNDLLHEAKKLRLLAAALELQHLTSLAANVVPIPKLDGEKDQRYVAIGTPDQVAQVLPASAQPADVATFDDGSTFQLTGWAGGAAPGGEFSTVTCERRAADGTVEVIHYVRAQPDRSSAPVSLTNYGDAVDKSTPPEQQARAVPDDESEAPSAKQEKLRALADRIDHEKLWRLPAMDRDKLTDDQRARLEAGIMLRRYGEFFGPGRWLLIPPTGIMQFGAGSLDKVYEMAKRDQDRREQRQAQSSAKGGDAVGGAK